MSDAWQVRDARLEDAAACAAIYAPYVTGTAVTFEVEPPSVDDFAVRIAQAQQRYAFIVLEQDERVVGYAYASPFAVRAAFRWACEVSIYLEQGLRGNGAGRALYEELLPRLGDRGYRMAMACVTLPNDASERLHRTMGFAPVARLEKIGFKLGDWRDVRWLQRRLGPVEEPPPPVPAKG